jgi:hypothetical protein
LNAPRRRARRRIAVGVAIAAAAAAIVSIVGVRIVESTQETDTSNVAASEVRSSDMVGANDVNVGNVSVTNGEPATIVLNVNYGVSGGTYGIEFRAGSVKKRLGDVHIRDGQGSWAAVVGLPNEGSGSIVLVDENGSVVCEGSVEPFS